MAELEGVSEHLVDAALECRDEEHFLQLLLTQQFSVSESRMDETGRVSEKANEVLCSNCLQYKELQD